MDLLPAGMGEVDKFFRYLVTVPGDGEIGDAHDGAWHKVAPAELESFAWQDEEGVTYTIKLAAIGYVMSDNIQPYRAWEVVVESPIGEARFNYELDIKEDDNIFALHPDLRDPIVALWQGPLGDDYRQRKSK